MGVLNGLGSAPGISTWRHNCVWLWRFRGVVLGVRFSVRFGFRFAVRIISKLPHSRFDVGNLQPGFVVAHRGTARREVNRYAFNTWHLPDAFLYASHAQHRQHVMHMNNTCFHHVSLSNHG